MNQVQNMSLMSRACHGHDDVHVYDVDQVERESRVPKWRSMMIKESAEDASIGKREAANLPETNGRTGAAEADRQCRDSCT